MKKIAIFLAMFAIVVSVVVSNSAFAISDNAIEAISDMGTDTYVAAEPVVDESVVVEPVAVEPIIEVKNPPIIEPTLELAVEEVIEAPVVEIRKSTSKTARLAANITPVEEEVVPIVVPIVEPIVTLTQRLDFNDDGRTGNLDVQLVQSSWGACPSGVIAGSFCMGDADLNGVVNFADITMLLANWSPRMRSDLNWDDVVGHVDLEMLLVDWQSCPSEENAECRADVNSDGSVNFADITALLADWTEQESTTPVL